jgi:hypothetical protein
MTAFYIWGAHASRVLRSASRRTLFAKAKGLDGTPKPARGTRALPGGLGLFLLFLGIVQADPFLPVQRLTLGNMNQDGDLFLRIKITSCELPDGTSFDIFLEHEMEAGDYNNIRSRFRLRPFETSVWEREVGELVWERPGGGRIIARRQGNAPTSRFPNFAKEGAVTAEWDETGNVWIKNAQWELNYENGDLAGIRHSESRPFSVRAGGGKITEIRAERKTLASVTWSKNGNPEKLCCGMDTYLFDEDSNGRLARVTDETIGAAIVEISYDETGLMSQIKRIGSENMSVEWRKNKGYGHGDSFYRNPFSVGKINGTQYDYHRDGNRATMRMKPSGAGWQCLRWESKNGKVTLIR